MPAPTIHDISDATGGQYIRLVQRKIGSRYVIVHVNRRAFMLGVGIEVCRYGWLWFIGPISLCIARPGNV